MDQKSIIRTRTGWNGKGVTKRDCCLSSPPPSSPDAPIGYTPPPVTPGKYSLGNTGFNNVPVVLVNPQQSELNTKYKLALLNSRREMSRFGFGLDVQGRLLSAEEVAMDPTEEILLESTG